MAAITEFPKIGSQPWKDMCLVFEENMIPIFKLDGGRYVHSGHQRQGPDMYERLACLNHVRIYHFQSIKQSLIHNLIF